MTRLLTCLLVITLAATALSAATAAPPEGATIVYSTYLGSDLDDVGYSVALDSAGRAYVTGYSSSPQFPSAAVAPEHGIDVFVARFNPSGSATEYLFWFNALTLFAEDEGYGVAADIHGNAYVTGYTRSADFCAVFGTVPGYHPTYFGETDAFVLKIKADGSGLAYCTFLGGSDWDAGRAITVDSAGNAYVVGGTWSTDFPTTANAIQDSLAGLRDTFLARLDATGERLEYATYLGGSGQEETVAVAITSLDGVTDDIVYAAGWTNSDDFPVTPGVLGPDYQGNADGLLYKLDMSSGSLIYATYLGGSGDDRPAALSATCCDRLVVSGSTRSSDFPTTAGAFDTTLDGERDGFVADVSSDGSGLAFSTFLGGRGDDWGLGVSIGSDSAIYAAGETLSADFPASPDALFPELNGFSDAFLAQISPDGAAVPYATFFGGSNEDRALSLVAGLQGRVALTGLTKSADFPTTPGAYDTTYNGAGDLFVTQLAVDPWNPPFHHLYLPLLRSQ